MTPKTLQVHYYTNARNEIKSGDILLCSGTSQLSNLIKKATKSPWSHVGFILRMEQINRLMVMESVESIGVRMVPLSSYMYDYSGSGKVYPGKILIARHDDVIIMPNLDNLPPKAFDLLGYPYGINEIIRIASKLTLKSIGAPLSKAPIELQKKKAYICSEYVQECFKHIGIDFYHEEGDFITPGDYMRDPKVKPLFYLYP